MTAKTPCYIGLMSGTSLDGIDGVLASFTDRAIKVHDHTHLPYPDTLRQAFSDLLNPADNEIERCVQASHHRNQIAAQVVAQLCSDNGRNSIISVADHGQTIRHFPDADPPYSLQLHQGAALAELSGIDCVVDFRSRDIAAGGQGAPLVPAFHQAFFAHSDHYRVIVNIGGIANISLLAPGGRKSPVGFDTGPGNTLLDSWCEKHRGAPFDRDGAWAASGQCNETLLEQLLGDEYFLRLPPKSTGREYFNPAWLEQKLSQGGFGNLPANIIQRTLTELTAHSIARGVVQAAERAGICPETDIEGIYICGGGAYNSFLQGLIRTAIPLPVHSSEQLGVPPERVEATAFAWLGKLAVAGLPIEISATTGARHDSVLGVVYRA